MVLIAVRVAKFHMSADETLLVAEQNHDLTIEKEDCIRQISDISFTQGKVRVLVLTCSQDMLRW